MVRLYTLYRATKHPISSHQLNQELRLRGFTFTVRSVGAILRGLEKRGYVASRLTGDEEPPRKVYLATVTGRQAIKPARRRLRAFFDLSDNHRNRDQV
jgi:DNA-binding PadR family transcriptional regulator